MSLKKNNIADNILNKRKIPVCEDRFVNSNLKIIL